MRDEGDKISVHCSGAINVCLALVVAIRFDRFLAVDAAGEGFVERSPSSIDEDEVAEDEPVEEVVS